LKSGSPQDHSTTCRHKRHRIVRTEAGCICSQNSLTRPRFAIITRTCQDDRRPIAGVHRADTVEQQQVAVGSADHAWEAVMHLRTFRQPHRIGHLDRLHPVREVLGLAFDHAPDRIPTGLGGQPKTHQSFGRFRQSNLNPSFPRLVPLASRIGSGLDRLFRRQHWDTRRQSQNANAKQCRRHSGAHRVTPYFDD